MVRVLHTRCGWARIVLAGLILLGLGGPAAAQLPKIRLDQIVPLGGGAGSEVEVELTGRDLEEVKALHFDHPGFSSTHVKDNKHRVKIAADVPAGVYELRAVGKYGISNARLFAVSREMTEVREKEPNDTPENAQAVGINTVINGTCDGNGDDYFRFPLKSGERVVIEGQAFRLDSTLRAVLSVSSADGKELAQSRPYYHRTDPLVDFVAPTTGDYLVRLHDATYSGGLPYRLTISNRPHIECVFPPVVVPGEKTELTVYGRNLPGGKAAPDWMLLDRPLDALTVSWTLPRDSAGLSRFDFREHPGAPSAAFRGVQPVLPGLEKALNWPTLGCADAPVVLEKEPNDTGATAQAIALPALVCGRLERPGDADWYAFKARAGETFRIDLRCERMGRPGDPFVLITDDKGKEVASLDDHGINFEAISQNNRDPLGNFSAPAEGKYRLLVQDRYRSGGARFLYLLTIRKPEPDFFPVVFHATNQEPSCPLVLQGGAVHCDICLNRQNLGTTVVVEAEGLPPGVRCPPVHISPQSEFAPLVFLATADAPAWSGAIKLRAWALVDGKRIEREVVWAERRRADANAPCRLCRQLCLAVRPGAPFAIKLQDAPATVKPGGSVSLKVSVERLSADFKDKVQLAELIPPPGFTVQTVDVAAGQKTAEVKLTVADNVPPGSYTVVLRGDAQVPFRRDPKGDAMNVRVSDPSSPATVVVVKPPDKK